MGSVYRASQSEPVKRQVALKLIKTGMDSRAVLARFDAERQALAMMDHTNIARIYDGGLTPAGQPFFVMELVKGVPPFNTQSMLGGALLGQKKFAEAEPLLLTGYEGMKQCEAAIPEQGKVRLPEALDRLIELFTATNKPEDIKKWQAERARFPAAAPPPAEKK